MPKDTKLSPEEIALFHEAMKDVRPLKKDNKILIDSKKPKPSPRRDNNISQDSGSLPQLYLSDASMEPVYAESVLSFMREPLNSHVTRQWHRGRINIDATLDLHHLTVEKSRLALSTFLLSCVEKNFRQVLVIHGKGNRSEGKMAILKSYINHWLPQCDRVLAFCSAHSHEGGTGAVKVLLKRQVITQKK